MIETRTDFNERILDKYTDDAKKGEHDDLKTFWK